MGAYSFSIPLELLTSTKDLLGCQVFVETGTFHGASSLFARGFFDQVLTCEYSEAIRKIAMQNFAGTNGIESFLGDSPDFLAAQRERYLSKATCFWLDAHWCASPVEVNSPGQTRILEEIVAIGELNESSVIFIDDARYYIAPPKPPNKWEDWPDIEAVILALRKISTKHQVVIYNDVICFFPARHKAQFVNQLFPKLVDPSESLKTVTLLTSKLIKKYVASPRKILQRIFG